MQSITLFATLVALANPALAVPAPASEHALVARQNGIPDGYNWTVSGWKAGSVSHSGAVYDFNVTGIKNGYLPGFKASCTGSESEYFKDCQLLEAETNPGTGPPFVVAKLAPESGDGVAHFAVSLKFQCDSCTEPANYNITAESGATYSPSTAPLQEFSIALSDVKVVA